MLTLRQIVDMADARVPNAETDATKATFLDALQRELYHRFDWPQETEKMLTVAGQMFYTLPDYIDPRRIVNVVLTDSAGNNPVPYYYRRGEDDVCGNFYFTLESATAKMIGLYPTPTVAGNFILITFEDGPNTLSSSNMTTVPRFFPDYHRLFVLALCAELAKLRKDVTLANNYTMDYQALLNEAISTINDDGQPLCVKSVW